jgi:hypothetical protein
MPVSKKRKKEGKKVERKVAVTPEEQAQAHAPEVQANQMQQRMGKPSNPFVAGKSQRHLGSQRGR